MMKWNHHGIMQGLDTVLISVIIAEKITHGCTQGRAQIVPSGMLDLSIHSASKSLIIRNSLLTSGVKGSESELSNMAHHRNVMGTLHLCDISIWQHMNFPCKSISVRTSRHHVIDSGASQTIHITRSYTGVPTIQDYKVIFMQQLMESRHITVLRTLNLSTTPSEGRSAHVG